MSAIKCYHEIGPKGVQSFQLSTGCGDDFIEWCPACGATRAIERMDWVNESWVEGPDTKVGRWRFPRAPK